MSTKLIAGAVIVIGALGATVPFHLSGQYAQDALDANMQQYLDIEPSYIELVDTDRKGEGLYASTIDYTFKLKMPEEIMAKMDDEAKANFEKMSFVVSHKLKHGFLSVDIDTDIGGEMVEMVKEQIGSADMTLEHPNQPLVTMKANAGFSLTGGYDMSGRVGIQGLSFNNIESETGGPTTVKIDPIVMDYTFNGSNGTYEMRMPKMNIGDAGSLVVVNNGQYKGDFRIDNEAKGAFAKYVEQTGVFSIESIGVEGDGQFVEMAKQLSMTWDSKAEGDRAKMNMTFGMAEFAVPNQPGANVAEMLLDLDFDFSMEAMESYYKAIQTAQQNPEDTEAIMNMFGKLLTDQMSITLNNFKAKTIPGPVALNGKIDMAGVPLDQFTANPMLVIGALKYNMGGELPKALLQMTGQFPPEMLDQLVEAQMIEYKDAQVVFKMDGEAGSVNLNGKPLM